MPPLPDPVHLLAALRSRDAAGADAAEAAARSLTAAGMRPGQRVLVRLPNGPLWVASVFGALLAGAVPVLAPPTASRARLRLAAERWRPWGIRAGSAPAADAPAPGDAAIPWERPPDPADGDAAAPHVVFIPAAFDAPDAAVTLAQVGRAAAALDAVLPLRADDRVLLGASLAEPASFALLVQALGAGAAPLLGEHAPPRRRDLQEQAPTVVAVPPDFLEHRYALLMRMLDELPLALGRPLEWSLARDGALAETLRSPLARRVRRRLGPRLRRYLVVDALPHDRARRLFAALGTPVHALWSAPAWGGVFACDGRPVPGVALTTDAAGEWLCAWDGESGVGAAGAVGEVGAASAASVRPGFPLRTGWCGPLDAPHPARDVIRLASGELRDPGRPERVLAADAGVARVVVVGEGMAAPVALVVPALGADPDALSARLAAAQERLPAPRRLRRFVFVADDPLLAAPGGRAWRQEVQARFAADLLDGPSSS